MDDHQTNHNETAIHGRSGKYIGDAVYGANDGIITTFAVVSGGAGAALSPSIIILGAASLIADGISMGLSNYLAITSRHAYNRQQRERETWEIEHLPDIERNEVREILTRWGVPDAHLTGVLEAITSDKKRWVDFMMREELNILEDPETHPVKHAGVTFIAFVIAGFMPLIPYVFGITIQTQFIVSIISTAVALFIVGALRTLVTKTGWLRSGAQMLIVGGIAALAAYGIGSAVKNAFGIVI